MERKGRPLSLCVTADPTSRRCKQLKLPVKYDKRRDRIEIMSGRLKNWRRVATRYDRGPNAFLSVIALAATVIYWI